MKWDRLDIAIVFTVFWGLTSFIESLFTRVNWLESGLWWLMLTAAFLLWPRRS